jgi:hypothetical protein
LRGRGGPPDFPRHRRPRRVAPCGGVVWLSWWIGRRLFLARGIRLPRRRHVGPGRRVRPDRLRQPRGLRRAAAAQEPSKEIGAMLLKHRQDGFWGKGSLCVHAAIDSVRALTDGSDETASTPKIVSDVAGGSLLQIGRQTLRPPVGGLSARASFPPALHQAAGGWHPAPSYFWPEGRRPSRESPQRHLDPWWPLQTSIMLPLVLSDIFYPAQFGSPSLRVTIRHPRSNYALRRIPFRRKSTKVHLSRACVRAGTATGRGISPRREVCRFACG